MNPQDYNLCSKHIPVSGANLVGGYMHCSDCQKKCEHNFTFGQIIQEGTGNPSSTAQTWYQQVALIVCSKCGELRKQIL